MSGILGQQPPQQPPQQANTYPANKDEVGQFILDLMKALYLEKQQAEAVKVLSANRDNIGHAIGQLAGSLVMIVVQKRWKQTGRKPHIKLIVQGTKKAIIELAEMARLAKIAQVTKEDIAAASQVAGKIIEAQVGQQPTPQGGM